MKRKGISPLIAAVLMIAFTMAIASLFSGWIQQTQSDTQEDVNEQRDKTLSCNRLGIEINEDQTDAQDVFVRQTRGDDPIGNISVQWTYTGSTNPAQGYVNITSQSGFDTSSAGDSNGNLESVTATSLQCGSVSDTYEP